MGRISNTEKYPIDNSISLNDYLIGTDADESNRTKNFKIYSLKEVLEGSNPSSTFSYNYQYVEDRAIVAFTEGRFSKVGSVNQDLIDVETLVFNKVNLAGTDISDFFNVLQDNTEYIVLKVSDNTFNNFAYYVVEDIANVVSSIDEYVFTVKVIGTVGTGELEDGDSYVISFDIVSNTGGFGKYINTDIMQKTVGGFIQGQPATPPEGLTQVEFNDKLLSDITLPTAVLSVNSSSIERYTDYVNTVTIQFTQNSGGAALSYSLSKDGVEISTDQSTSINEVEVGASFTLQGEVNYDSGEVDAGTVDTSVVTINTLIPQWKGEKDNDRTLDGTSYSDLNLDFDKIVQGSDNTSITVSAGNYGVFLSTNDNATIIDAGTGFELNPSSYVKNNITVEYANGLPLTLTEYILNTATLEFTYNIQ
ncbi:MAG: hypothetical protein HRU18_03520 [Pseudoalteromonas sp.]|uniref:hypothetical protein n=1 Tax=Pseudoalteromonas sp. TaxID=53249 RepID=UPI001D517297|nr:hypothetical protein [Pseudoalteromonas sp.]NRA77255.1 hypothetical protein [Pseudoalteromonas sp.]